MSGKADVTSVVAEDASSACFLSACLVTEVCSILTVSNNSSQGLTVRLVYVTR